MITVFTTHARVTGRYVQYVFIDFAEAIININILLFKNLHL